LAHYKIKTRAEIAKLLDCTEENIRGVCKELNLPDSWNVCKEEADNKVGRSVREILGSYELPEAGHYHGVFGRLRY
jgi:hypothetical protein